jgi:predicted O-linked N-acetylglucosamine transferase (SPINDLY family)
VPSDPARPALADRVTSMNAAEAISAAERLASARDSAGAMELYRSWLRGPGAGDALAYAVAFNLGVLLREAGLGEEAEAAYRQAIALNPECGEAQFNLGTLLEYLNRTDEAVAQWESMLDSGPPGEPRNQKLLLLTLNNLGRLLEILKRYPPAEAYLTRSLTLDANQRDVIQHLVYLRQKQCKWPIDEPVAGVGPEAMLDGAGPLSLLAIADDPEQQLARARRHAEEKIFRPSRSLSDGGGYEHARLRVGYLSSDFCLHPVAMLTVELFELHDRSRFEVYAFSWSRDDGSPLRRRVVGAFDRYIRIDGLDDEAAARLIREMEIDVLVDLHGLTLGARPGILAWRPAPVQITYLGFPGTTGIPGVDFVLADRFVLPEEEAANFSEKPLYLPHCFQVSDRRREVGERPARGACGLPERGFVFCCFNNNYKFTRQLFSVWMRILQRVPGSVLWLLADNSWAEDNLRKAAMAQGVDPARLIFAGRVAPADYLARYAVADLFLDTHPFGAGTTANDALWQGLPVLTRPGRSFASRYAGSLLKHLDLPQLIAADWAEYEDRAVEIGGHPETAARLRTRIESGKEQSVVFDIPRLVRDIEQAYVLALTEQKRRAAAAPREAAPRTDQDGRIRLAVYTVLVGEKEALNDPLCLTGAGAETDLALDFYCFTDNETLTSPTWKFIRFGHGLIPPEKMSREPKARPHLHFPDHDYSLYIDNTVAFKRLPRRADIGDALFRGFRHPWRNSPLDEADIVAKSGLDDTATIADQVNFYLRNHLLDAVGTLTAGTVLLRRHHHPGIRKFGELWWEQILLFSKRDQLSLDLCARMTDCPVDYFPGDKTNNELFFWPVLSDGRRVQGSFDAERYAWEKRADPEARLHPRSHYLRHAEAGANYDRPVPWFRYACERVGSGLGDRFAPRRGIADIVGRLLDTAAAARILIVGIRSARAYGVEPEELHLAEQAMYQYARYGNRPKVVTALVGEDDLDDPAPFRAAANGTSGFDLALVIGIPEAHHASVLGKFLPLLGPGGRMLLQFGESLTLADMERMGAAPPAPGRLEVFHGRHILDEQVIPSSVIVFIPAGTP